MANYNRVILAGNLTRDVELKSLASGTSVADCGIAVNDRIKKDDVWVDDTSFFDLTMWGRTAETASEFLTKGSPILVEGRLKQDTWDSEGQKRSKVKVVVERLQFLGKKGDAPTNSNTQTSIEPETIAAGVGDDDIDF